MADFHYSTDNEGIATISWDVGDARMNVMSQNGFTELERYLDDALADDSVKGIVITSGKKDFAAGMDLNLLAGMKEGGGSDPARGIFEQIMRIHGLLRKIERAGMDPATLQGGKPVAAALPGTALGLGYKSRLLATGYSARTMLQQELAFLKSGSGCFREREERLALYGGSA